jgi:hypothetical protein
MVVGVIAGAHEEVEWPTGVWPKPQGINSVN